VGVLDVLTRALTGLADSEVTLPQGLADVAAVSVLAWSLIRVESVRM